MLISPDSIVFHSVRHKSFMSRLHSEGYNLQQQARATNLRLISVLVFCLYFITGTRKAAALSMSPARFHNLHSATCVPGNFASCSKHLQFNYDRKSDP